MKNYYQKMIRVIEAIDWRLYNSPICNFQYKSFITIQETNADVKQEKIKKLVI